LRPVRDANTALESSVTRIKQTHPLANSRITGTHYDRSMSNWRAFCETVHIVALAMWLGFVVAAGTFAATVFSVTKALDPRLPGYEAYTGEHYLIVGGKMAQTVFFVTDVVQFACSLAAVVSLIVIVGAARNEARRLAIVVRTSAVIIALAAVAALLLVVNPKLIAATSAYWKAAKAGDMEAVGVHRAIAADTHPYASALMVTVAIMVLLAIVSAVWSIARPHVPVATARAVDRLPEPALLRGRRA